MTYNASTPFISSNQSLFSWKIRSLLIATVSIFLIVFLKNGWVCDDGYIIFRSIEQLFTGNGPIWNYHERVQVFTSPLWYWLNTIPRLFSSDVYLNVLILSLILSLATLYQLYKIVPNAKLLLIATLTLACSNAFFDYTSSGLENPLAYLLITTYVRYFLLLNSDTPLTIKQRENFLQWTIITYGLLLTTRHDLSLLLLPATIYLLWKNKTAFNKKKWLIVATLTLAPLIAWSLFALFFYGSIFPNTAYAKLNTGIARIDLITQSFYYFLATIKYDLITLLIITASIFIGFFTKRAAYTLLALGVILNLLYVVYVGGDFMQGRFLSYAFLVALISLLVLFRDSILINNHSDKSYLAITIALIIYAAAYPHTPANSPLEYANKNKHHGIADERGYYFLSNSLYQYIKYHQETLNRPEYFPEHPWSMMGWQASQREPTFYSAAGIGMFGYWSGEKIRIIDIVALADPLLSRLPADDLKQSYIGHYVRTIPEGYIESLQSGRNQFKDKKLGEYYEKVKIITQSDKLVSWERLKTILIMNLGGYEHLIEHLKNND